MVAIVPFLVNKFQSTLPLRGATGTVYQHGKLLFISIHAPLAGSDQTVAWSRQRPSDFNPRSPCGERQFLIGNFFVKFGFQSTLPLRGATGTVYQHGKLLFISIHAPLAGSDQTVAWSRQRPSDFNPRSPCGERQFLIGNFFVKFGFQSTLPLRGATALFTVRGCGARLISIHAPLAGSDSTVPAFSDSSGYFNPRSPCGERRRL